MVRASLGAGFEDLQMKISGMENNLTHDYNGFSNAVGVFFFFFSLFITLYLNFC